VIHRPSASPVVFCGFEINAGSRREPTGSEGLAHFCEHVSFKGTRHRLAWHILNCLESVGGDLNAFTNKEDTVFYAAILKDHLNKAVDLLYDIVFCSTYPEEEIRHEVDVICDEIESYNDSPAELIYDEFENMIFPNHPLGHNILGTRERVLSFTGADARRFTERYYRPDNAIFFAYGDVDFSRMVQRLERCMERQGERNSRFAILQPTSFPQTGTAAQQSQEHHQSHVMLGSRAYSYDDERRLPLYLLNNLLGGPGMNARLNLSLREKNGLVYTVESAMASYSDTGCWSVYFGCDHHDVKRCLRLVHRELDKVMQHPLTERQLVAAKRQLKGQIAIACDNREQFALDIAKNYLHYGRERDIDDLLQRIDAITAPQIQEIAQELFAPERLQQLIL
jgi:predicted Zn-dependent peptidase